MRMRGALAVAAMLLLAGCSSTPAPGGSPQSEPAQSESGQSQPGQSEPATISGAAESGAAGPLEVEPLRAYEPAEPASPLPCSDGFRHLAIADDPRAVALEIGDSDGDSDSDADNRIGIVLGHQSNEYVCQWEAEARRLAELGYTVIIPTLHLSDPLAAMLAAEQRLRSEGATEVVLAGASMGGLLAIAAAAVVDEAPAGVIALAPPLAYGGVDLHDFAPHLDAPVLLQVGSDDADLPEQAAEIAGLLPTPPGLTTVDTAEHGVPLLEHADARTAWDAFLADVASLG